MRYIYVLLFCLGGVSVYAQDFLTEISFVDKDGAKDTLWVGLDETATYGVDAIFGEESVLVDEQIGTFRALFFDGINTFQKKQIVPITQGWIERGALRILIPNDKLPVTVSWNNAAFNEPNKACSLITDWPLGGWFDVTAGWEPFKEYLKDTAFVVVPQENSQAAIYLAGTNQEPMRLIYIAFGNESNVTELHEATSQKDNIMLFNLDNNLLYLNSLSSEKVRIVGMDGRLFLVDNGPIINCNLLPKGVFCALTEINNNHICFKFIKK